MVTGAGPGIKISCDIEALYKSLSRAHEAQNNKENSAFRFGTCKVRRLNWALGCIILTHEIRQILSTSKLILEYQLSYTNAALPF